MRSTDFGTRIGGTASIALLMEDADVVAAACTSQTSISSSLSQSPRGSFLFQRVRHLRQAALMHNQPTTKYPVVSRLQAHIHDWADELAATLGRPADDIRRDGLSTSDFPSNSQLHVKLMDGSWLRFRHAFHVLRQSEHALAIFTEHCGYHVFPLHDAEVSRVTETSLYPPSAR